MEFKNLPPVKEQLMKCVRCGKCRSVCPVFAESGIETTAPGVMFLWYKCSGMARSRPARKYTIG